jgi:hypothetical protein
MTEGHFALLANLHELKIMVQYLRTLIFHRKYKIIIPGLTIRQTGILSISGKIPTLKVALPAQLPPSGIRSN